MLTPERRGGRRAYRAGGERGGRVRYTLEGGDTEGARRASHACLARAAPLPAQTAGRRLRKSGAKARIASRHATRGTRPAMRDT